MNKKEFKKILKEKEISFEEKDKWLIINDSEYNVYLPSLTSLPANTKFENGGDVDLDSLTSLPASTKFENGGYVYLRSLKSLPENTKFENGGDVYLPSLTSLPASTKFENGGYVYLSSLTSLPASTKFENGGSVNLYSLTSLPANIKFENGGYVNLESLTSLPANIKFENGGNVYLPLLTSLPAKTFKSENGGYVYLKNNKTIKQSKSYIERYNLEKENNFIYVYKRVSKDLKTQEDTKNETTWTIGKTLTVPNWNTDHECGEGKFHACAKPRWCDVFRNKKDDRYIKIKVNIVDIHEFENPIYPQKIAFRKGKVVEVVKH